MGHMTDLVSNRRVPDAIVARAVKRRARILRQGSKLLIHTILILGGFLVMIPFFWMVSSSLKPDWEIFQIPPTWIPEEPIWGNYYTVITGLPYREVP